MKTAVILSSCRSRSTRRWQSAHSFPVATLNWLPLCMVCSAIPSRSFRPHPLQRRCRLRGKELRRRLPMFPANTNSVKLKKIPFSGRFQPQGEDFCMDLPRRRGKIIQPCPNWRWEPPHLCGGRSALELRERVSPLITRFCSGNAKTSLIPG
jgi:hypothetical protein